MAGTDQMLICCSVAAITKSRDNVYYLAYWILPAEDTRPLSHSVSRLGRPAHPKNSIFLNTNISTSNGFYMPIDLWYVPIQRTTVDNYFETSHTLVQNPIRETIWGRWMGTS